MAEQEKEPPKGSIEYLRWLEKRKVVSIEEIKILRRMQRGIEVNHADRMKYAAEVLRKKTNDS